MLRAAPSPVAAPELSSVVLLGIEPELARYLAQHLSRRWPWSHVSAIGGADELARHPAQLCIRCCEPDGTPDRLTLWLDTLERRHYAARLDRHLWRSTTPVTGRSLVRLVENMLRQAAAG